MTIKRILVGSLITNCYLLLFSDRAVVIDPGDNPEKILKFCGNLKISDILLTHGHLDHTAALCDLVEQQNCRVWMHKDDECFLNDDVLRAPASVPKPDWRYDYKATNLLSDGDKITISDPQESVSFHVIHTPGHTPGSICFYLEKQNVLFSGDTLFKEARGRTDFPKSDEGKMAESLKKLSLLPQETLVYPGHGFSTKICDEGWIAGDLI